MTQKIVQKTGQKNVLGKGLASLFPNMSPTTPEPATLAASENTLVNSPVNSPINAPTNNSPVNSQNSSIISAPAPSSASQSSGTNKQATNPTNSPTSGQTTPESTSRDVYMGISMIPIEDIQTNHYQPRRDFDEQALQELSQSIKISGIIQPLLVRKSPKEGFELIAGERRLRAAKLAGLKYVPIVIRKSTDRETLELALVENIQRQDLNCVDEALAYHLLMEDFSLTQEEVAKRVGKDRATVANFLRLLRLPHAIIDDLRKQLLTFGHAKVLLSLEAAEERLSVRAQILENQLSVRETERLVEDIKKTKSLGPAKIPPDVSKSPAVARLNTLALELTRDWFTRVEIKGSENRGKITFHYATRQELDRLLERLDKISTEPTL